MAGFCGHGNEHSASIKDGEFLDQLSDNEATFSKTILLHEDSKLLTNLKQDDN
jgi:hypothetical protein